MHPTLQNLLALLGRIGLSGIFIFSGIGKAMAFHSTTAYMASKGLPFVEIGAIIAILIEVFGGLLLLIGWKTRLAALIIALFVIAVSLTMHTFWSYAEPEAQSQMIHFMKNFTILGGLFYVIAFGAGRYSVDGCCKKRSIEH